MPYIGQGLQQGRRQLHTFTATASQTTFSVAYSPGYVDVYQNGILLAPSDFTATNGTTVVLAVGAAVNDEITIIAQHLFSVADVVSASQGGTFAGDVTMTGNLTVQGTTITVDTSTAQTLAMGDADKIILGDDNDLQMYHTGTVGYIDNNTGSLYIRNNVDDDDGGNIIIEAKSGKASIVAQDDEGVRLYYDDVEKLATTSTGIDIANGTGTIFNNSGTFTIDANTNLTLRGGVHTFDNADGSVEYARIDTTGNVGIGESSPDTLLHISGAPDNKVITIDQNGRASAIGTYFSSGATDSRIDFYVSDGNTNGSSNNRMSIMGSGNVGIGTTSPGTRLQVAGTQNTPSSTSKGMLLVRADGSSHGLQMGVMGTTPWGSWIQAQDNDIATAYPLSLQPGGGIVHIPDTARLNVGDTLGDAVALTSTYKASIQGYSSIGRSTALTHPGSASSTKHYIYDRTTVGDKVNLPLEVYFPNNVSNLAIRLYYNDYSLWVSGEAITGSTYSNAPAMGFRRYSFSHNYNGSTNYQNVLNNTENVGTNSSHMEFNSHGWDANESGGAHYFEFRHIASTGNTLYLQFCMHGSGKAYATGTWYFKFTTY